MNFHGMTTDLNLYDRAVGVLRVVEEMIESGGTGELGYHLGLGFKPDEERIWWSTLFVFGDDFEKLLAQSTHVLAFLAEPDTSEMIIVNDVRINGTDGVVLTMFSKKEDGSVEIDYLLRSIEDKQRLGALPMVDASTGPLHDLYGIVIRRYLEDFGDNPPSDEFIESTFEALARFGDVNRPGLA